MKHVKVYGSSDDLMEIEGDVPGCDEYNGEHGAWTVAGLRIALRYGDNGCWHIKVGQIDEDVAVTAENLTLSINPRIDGRPGYSMLLDLDVPDDAYVTAEAVPA